ncbi:MAG: DEAD/DEAH box helicase [Sandaracinaceae bacterium]|nr:DEAD/DEAH box helicase [Sandaracinaceae bacterium]
MEKQVRDLARGAQIVSGTPGRVLDHLRRGTLDSSPVKVLVLDEADEMLSMGFAKELHSILELLPKSRQTLFFSATIDDAVRRMADRHMREPEFIALSSDAVGAATISHFVYSVTGHNRTSDLIRILEVEDPQSAIIFCNTKIETERVATDLAQAGFNADWLNGDLPQSDREQVMASTREGRIRYLVATDVAARGIDVSHLTHVINYSLPESVENYVHRTGRTGRAGRTGTAISLVGPREIGALYYLRLQYKIFPIERTLPSAGEERTRKETDKLAILAEAFANDPSDHDLAIARRLLTHPSAEKLLSGLLAAFFGAKGSDVEEEAAAARRARPPVIIERTRRAEKSRGREFEERPARGRESSPDRGPRTHAERAPAAAERAPAVAERAPAAAERAPAAAERAPAPRVREITDVLDRAEVDARPRPAVVAQAPRVSEASVDGDKPVERTRRRRTRTGHDADPTIAVLNENRDDAQARESFPQGDQVEDPNAVSLYLNVGRRDGVRVGDLSRFLRDTSGLPAEEIGRIRMRDKHTFVAVPKEKVDAVLESLRGKSYNDRALDAAVAKALARA